MSKSNQNQTKKLTLGDTQRLFMSLLPKLIQFAYDQGYELTLGDGFRDSRVFGKIGVRKKGAYGRKASNHKRRLALDLNLFKNSKWLTKTSDHKFLGEYWESLHPLCSWGGRFNDGNHYSLIYRGFR